MYRLPRIRKVLKFLSGGPTKTYTLHLINMTSHRLLMLQKSAKLLLRSMAAATATIQRLFGWAGWMFRFWEKWKINLNFLVFPRRLSQGSLAALTPTTSATEDVQGVAFSLNCRSHFGMNSRGMLPVLSRSPRQSEERSRRIEIDRFV